MFLPLLKIENVSKCFDGIQAIQNLSFSANENEIIGLIGPNGAGKTTLFQLISGFEKINQGIICFRDQPIHLLKAPEIALKGIARTFQLAKPFSNLTVIENVIIGGLSQGKPYASARLLALEILEQLELSAKGSFLADHLTLPDKKRLELARALSMSPKLLLLDEIMAGMRPQEIDSLINIIKHLQQKFRLTIIMIEHNMRGVMKCCQRIIVLHQGQKLAEDTPERIQKHPEVIKTYLGSGLC